MPNMQTGTGLIDEFSYTIKDATFAFDARFVGIYSGGAWVAERLAKMLPGGDAVFDRPHASRTAADLQGRRVIDALKAAAMAHCHAAAPVEPTPEVWMAWA